MKYKFIHSVFIILHHSLEMVKKTFRPNPVYIYMYLSDDCVHHMKVLNKNEPIYRKNLELGQYRKNFGQYKKIGRVCNRFWPYSYYTLQYINIVN